MENFDFPYISCIPSNPVPKLWHKPVHGYAFAETQDLEMTNFELFKTYRMVNNELSNLVILVVKFIGNAAMLSVEASYLKLCQDLTFH